MGKKKKRSGGREEQKRSIKLIESHQSVRIMGGTKIIERPFFLLLEARIGNRGS